MASELNMGMKCIKYMLLTVNSMFLLTATLILSIGTTIYAIYYDFRHFITDGFFSPAALLIVIGIIMFAVSLFGCLGAAKESTCMINFFALMLTIVFVLEIAASIAAYSSIGGINHIVGDKFNYTIHKYDQGRDLKHAVDTVQKKLTCCGVFEAEDWKTTEWYLDHMENMETSNITREYPDSCYAKKSEEPYVDGCMNGLANIITQSAVLLGTGAMTIAFIQMVGIIFSVMLAKAIRQAKSDRERRRWEIREQVINAYSQMESHKPKKQENTTPVIYIPTIGNSQA